MSHGVSIFSAQSLLERVGAGIGRLIRFSLFFSCGGLQSVAAKPLFFDLAGDAIDFPDLTDRVAKAEAELGGGGVSGMLTGAVKSLGGWFG